MDYHFENNERVETPAKERVNIFLSRKLAKSIGLNPRALATPTEKLNHSFYATVHSMEAGLQPFLVAMETTLKLPIFEEISANDISNPENFVKFLKRGYQDVYVMNGLDIPIEELPIRASEMAAVWQNYSFYEAPRDRIKAMIDNVEFQKFLHYRDSNFPKDQEIEEDPEVASLVDALAEEEISLQEAKDKFIAIYG